MPGGGRDGKTRHHNDRHEHRLRGCNEWENGIYRLLDDSTCKNTVQRNLINAYM